MKNVKMGQDKRLKRCLSTIEAQKVMKELHEGAVGGHFATKITQENFRCKVLVAHDVQIC
jgi:hypothetical protein